MIRKLLGVPANRAARGVVTSPTAAVGRVSNPETYLGLQYQTGEPLIEVQPGTGDYPAAEAVGGRRADRLERRDLTHAGQDRRRARREVVRRSESVTSDDSAATILIGTHANRSTS